MPRRLVSMANHAVAAWRQRMASGRAEPVARWPDLDGSHTGGDDAPDQGAITVALLDALPDAALLLDGTLMLLHGNARARELLGALRIGAHLARTSRHPELMSALAVTQKSGDQTSFNLIMRRPIERHLEGAITALATSQTSPADARILVILQDLSERDALARTRVEFVSNASHELRTPLASLSGFIETLSGPAKNDPAARERFLGIMAEQAARMTRLIDDLLLLSRVEMKAHVAPTSLVDLNEVMADVVQILARTTAAANITLTCVPSPVAIHVHGDHDELIQAVQNLAQNALKYGTPKGHVTVRASVAADGQGTNTTASISVTDDGPGIAAEHLPRLTERFYRVSTIASREKGGTGLGLAIVKHIASRHGGKLEIASQVGKGSAFTMTIPVAGGKRDLPGHAGDGKGQVADTSVTNL